MPHDELAAWHARLQAIQIPVLRQTARSLDRLHANPDKLDAQQLNEVILNDPLMTLRVLADAAALRKERAGRIVTEVESATAAILMMGLQRFGERHGNVPIVEDRLADHAHALAAVQRLVRRSARAAAFAGAFCAQRQDPDVVIIYESALLHDFAELLLWIEYPAAGLAIEHRHREHRVEGGTAAQRHVMGFALSELAQELMRSWSLPMMLQRLSRDVPEEASTDSQARMAHLAVRLARHSESGWSHPALSDDLEQLSRLLNLSLAATRRIALAI